MPDASDTSVNVGDEQVQPAIVVVVQPAGRDRPWLAQFRIHTREARLPGDVGETALPQVSVEYVSVHACNEDIDASVIVEVRRGGSHRVPFTGHAGPFGDVREGEVAVVAEEAVVELPPCLPEAGNGRAVREVDVRAAVAVEVERGHAAHHQFDLVVTAARRVAQLETEARFPCDLLETDRCNLSARRYARGQSGQSQDGAHAAHSISGFAARPRSGCTGVGGLGLNRQGVACAIHGQLH
jgi:hypothetical protein